MKITQIPVSRFTPGQWTAIALCFALLTAWALEQLVFKVDAVASPLWLQPVAALLAAAGIMQLTGAWKRFWQVLHLVGLLFMVWAANGIIFDFLRMAGLIGDPATGLPAPVDWPGTILRILALATAVALARLALSGKSAVSARPAAWYGYAAFLLALPYPVFRIIWALGGTPGITHAGAAGEGFSPLILAIPWIMAAVLSLLLVSPRAWMPRRLLLVAGWSATAIVASIGPAAFWSVISKLISGRQLSGDIAGWVFCLFYTSWFLWAIFAFAATRSYQLRSRVEVKTKADQTSSLVSLL